MLLLVLASLLIGGAFPHGVIGVVGLWLSLASLCLGFSHQAIIHVHCYFFRQGAVVVGHRLSHSSRGIVAAGRAHAVVVAAVGVASLGVLLLWGRVWLGSGGDIRLWEIRAEITYEWEYRWYGLGAVGVLIQTGHHLTQGMVHHELLGLLLPIHGVVADEDEVILIYEIINVLILVHCLGLEVHGSSWLQIDIIYVGYVIIVIIYAHGILAASLILLGHPLLLSFVLSL